MISNAIARRLCLTLGVLQNYTAQCIHAAMDVPSFGLVSDSEFVYPRIEEAVERGRMRAGSRLDCVEHSV